MSRTNDSRASLRKMIDPEQKELASYVKQVHLSLRRKTREIGAEKAWEEHLKNEETLKKYAISMKKLAQKYWSVNNETQASEGVLCRIQWIVQYVVNYFEKGLIRTEYEKEVNKMKKFYSKGLISEDDLNLYSDFCYRRENKLKVLDVGSCYNPLKEFNFLEVYPIDLYPARSEVKKCNFIEIQVGKVNDNWFRDNLTEIPENYFDVVVFCLFLEYLPSPKQREFCCCNAFRCLKTNGLLLIVTPDSKHESANSVIMKKWKLAGARLGFVRSKLEKLKYLYCMAFRKAASSKYPVLLYDIDNSHEDFVIPQDFVNYDLTERVKTEENLEKSDEVKEHFDELPFL